MGSYCLALRVMVTESLVDCENVGEEEYVTDVGSDVGRV